MKRNGYPRVDYRYAKSRPAGKRVNKTNAKYSRVALAVLLICTILGICYCLVRGSA